MDTKKIYKTKEDFVELLNSEQYDFLRNKDIFPNGLMMVGLGGSYAYDTNKKELKVVMDESGTLLKKNSFDVQGNPFNTRENILFIKDFELNSMKTKQLIPSLFFNKYAKLLYTCNPNILEIMGLCRRNILDFMLPFFAGNAHHLTRKVYYTFGRYAEDQLGRVQNALARDSMAQVEKEMHILKSVRRQMEQAMQNASRKLKIDEEFKVYIADSIKEDMDKEIVVDARFKAFPLRDFTAVLNSMLQTVKLYGKLNKRNRKKSQEKLEKHCMHLVRLMKMGTEILSGKGIITSRKEAGDIDLLSKIRNGEIPISVVLTEIYPELSKELGYAFDNSVLPDETNYDNTKEIIMHINELTLKSKRKTTVNWLSFLFCLFFKQAFHFKPLQCFFFSCVINMDY